MKAQLIGIWLSAIEQLGPAGAVLAAAAVMAVLGVLALVGIGAVATRAMRRHEESRPRMQPVPMSPARRRELRRRIDARVGIEASNVVDLRSRR